MAVITISNTGGNWNATTTWVGGVVPVLGDSVVAAATSGPLTVNITTAACTSINFTNYVNTFTISSGQTLTVSGGVTFVAGMTVAGTGTFAVNATSSFTSAGLAMPFGISFSGAITVTLQDNLTVNGLLSLGSTATTTSINGNTITASGGVTMNGTGTTTIVTGTTNLKVTGGTINGNSNATTTLIQLRLNLEIAGNVTFTNGAWFYYNTNTLTHTSGTVTTTGSSIANNGINTTYACSGITWNTFSAAAGTLTLNQDLNVSGLLQLSGGALTVTLAGTGKINCSGNFDIGISTGNNTTCIITGGEIVMTGTGTIQSNGTTTKTAQCRSNLTINTTGTITISGNIYYNTGTLKYIAGTVITTGSTLNITLNVTTTLDTNGIIWNSIYTGNNLTTTVTVSLVSDLVTTNLTCGYSTTFTTTGAILTVSNNLSFTTPTAGLVAMSFVYYLPNDLVVNNLTFSYGYYSSGGNTTPTTIYNYSITVLKDITLTRPGTSVNSNYAGLNGTTKVIWKPQNEGTFNIGTIATGGNLYGVCIMVPFILDNGKKYNFNSIQCSINSSDFQINSSGNMKLSGNLTIVGGTFKCTNNSVDASNLSLQITNGASSAVFTDVHKIVFKSIDIVASTTTIMNEFFSGSPKTITAINSTTTGNYTISFSDGFEKIAKFVNINYATFTRPQQLLLITKSPMKSTNTRGIRYINQSPNGVAKNMLYSMDETYKAQMLTSDPTKI